VYVRAIHDRPRGRVRSYFVITVKRGQRMIHKK
jgi:hypothetical protein